MGNCAEIVYGARKHEGCDIYLPISQAYSVSSRDSLNLHGVLDIPITITMVINMVCHITGSTLACHSSIYLYFDRYLFV